MSKPHIVLVPGAWHAPFYMDTLVSKLQDLGYTIHARQMPSVGNPSPPTDLTQDIATLRSLVSDAIGSANNDVVVICHSWGGIVTGSGLVGLSKTERLAEGKSGGVVKTGYIAAFIVPEGVSLMDAGGDRQPEWFDIQGPHVYATDPSTFYSDLPSPLQSSYHAQLQSHSLATLHAPATAASWRVIPTEYLLCELDEAIPWQGQQAMIDGVREQGGVIEVTRIAAGHSPFLSRVDETVGWVRGIVGE